MAKFELKFLDADCNDTYITSNAYFGENLNRIWIEIGSISDNEQKSFILLDKSTAIKFAKTLRTEINKITESEVKNG
jgi:hypothetical protein